MRRILPGPIVDVDPLDWYGQAQRAVPAERPWVLLNMVVSVDGATALDGVSGGLGGPGDRAVFSAVRALPDIIVAAAQTVRSETYGPPRPSTEVRVMRRARGQAEVPQIGIVTRSVGLDFDAPLFADAEHPPLVITTENAPADRIDAAGVAGAEVLVAGVDDVDLAVAFGRLRALGHEIVLVEGGPSLNGQLIAAGLVDEVCVTVAPKLVAGGAARLAHGDLAVNSDFTLDHVLELDGELCCRYVRADALGDTMQP